MASQSQGIQHLLAAEKKAADIVSDARKRKTKRLKQAKEEAAAEIEQYRAECERKFREKQKSQHSKDDFHARIEKETEERLIKMGGMVNKNEDEVINRILSLVYDIKPELHQNFQV